jgi:NitT/TauT family transport system substrate-binding protein
MASLLFACGAEAARAEDALRIAAGQMGNWASSVAEVGKRAGIFKRHGLTLEILYTQGSGETQQAVIANSVDVGVAPGTMGVMSAFAKGAPIRIIGAETTGASDLYWYVKADSPVRSLKDFAGKSVAYSTNGASTQGVVLAWMRRGKLDCRAVATGNPTATLTQVMSGQVDVGWSAPPDGLDQLDRHEIRYIANGNDDTPFKNQTVRVLVVNSATLAARKDAITRFMQAYRETARRLYADDSLLSVYADWLHFPVAKAKRTRDDFYPWEALDPDGIMGLDLIAADAVTLRYLPAALTADQIAALVQRPPPQ